MSEGYLESEARQKQRQLCALTQWNMMHGRKDQTLLCFKSHAENWQTKATDQAYSLIEQA